MAKKVSRFFAVLEEEHEEDPGKEGLSVGDLYAFYGLLFDESKETELGRFDSVGTTASSPGLSAEARRLCNVTSTFVEERDGAEIDGTGWRSNRSRGCDVRGDPWHR